jgi:hypothetical protein
MRGGGGEKNPGVLSQSPIPNPQSKIPKAPVSSIDCLPVQS